MNICVFYYDGFCEFEVVLTFLLFSKENIFSASLENRVYISEEKQKYLPDKTIKEINSDDIDLFIIPGGNPSYLYSNEIIKDFIKELNLKNKYIAGICSGTKLMAKFGILNNKKCTGDSSGIKADADYIELFNKSIIQDEDIVVDGNTITSTGQAFIEFVIKLGKIMNIYKDKEEMKSDYKWLKNIKD
jgi:4-methyl-5(b-hydroxyethyl)-thiazole monophosphate biosynthesis